MYDEIEADEVDLFYFDEESDFIRDYEFDETTECHACFGTGIDRELDSDCLICYGYGDI